MKVNVGGADRILRIVVGLALILLVLSGQIGVWGWIGVVPLATGTFRLCPAYLPFGLSTCPMKKGSLVASCFELSSHSFERHALSIRFGKWNFLHRRHTIQNR